MKQFIKHTKLPALPSPTDSFPLHHHYYNILSIVTESNTGVLWLELLAHYSWDSGKNAVAGVNFLGFKGLP